MMRLTYLMYHECHAVMWSKSVALVDRWNLYNPITPQEQMHMTVNTDVFIRKGEMD